MCVFMMSVRGIAVVLLCRMMKDYLLRSTLESNLTDPQALAYTVQLKTGNTHSSKTCTYMYVCTSMCINIMCTHSHTQTYNSTNRLID